ncbi:MAG: glycosyltransferase family 2 protein [Bacteroidales bacterium]|nr:glycosyltransferase family 2 protein [Bacteroidales bacterium]
MPKTAVVILNWNGIRYKHLSTFLPKVIEHSSADAEVIVADNHSTDNSVAWVKENYPGLRIIENPTNAGFATGYNLALRQIEADYYVLLNSDIEVTGNWISPVIELMEKDHSIAACQPKILNQNEGFRNEFEYAGAAGGFIDKYGYPFCRGRLFQHLEKDEGQYNDIKEIFWATGACMFVRADVYHELGGLDDDFFAHMEEIDLCWRMKNEGHRIMYCGESAVYHVGGGTLPKKYPKKTYLNFRNNLSLLFKNLPGERLIKVYIARIFLDSIAALKFLAEGSFMSFVAVTRAHISFLRTYRKTIKKRRATQHKHVSCIYYGNIAFDHYLRNKKHFPELPAAKFSK